METVKQGVDQKLVEGQEKLSQMWLTWNQKKQLQGVEGDLPKQEVTHCGAGRVGLGALTSLSTPLLRGPTCLECSPPPRLPVPAFRTLQPSFLFLGMGAASEPGALDSDVSEPAKPCLETLVTFPPPSQCPIKSFMFTHLAPSNY